MIKFNFRLKGFDQGKKITIKKSQQVLFKSMFKMEQIAIDKAPFDKGFLRENITLFPQILASQYFLRSNAPDSEALEYGNTPREVKFEDIEAWAKRKGIIDGNDDYGFVSYVTEKIRREGVNAHPFMRPALNEVKTFWMPQYEKDIFQTQLSQF